MDFQSSNLGCEKDCQEIHATWNRLNNLGLALALPTLADRQQIKETYRAAYGEDLVEHLRRTVMANQKNEMCNILYLWILEPTERDAIVARNAIGCGITDYKALVEIYAQRKSNQLFYTKQAYLAKYKRNLDQDIIDEPPHPYQGILVALATSHRSHHEDISRHIAKCDAKRLYEAGKGSTGAVDESVILEIFSKRSIPQLRLALASYKHIYGHDYTKTLKKEGCGQFEDSLRMAVKCIYSPAKYYSKLLHTSTKSPATDKRVLTRAILGSTEVGMEEVKSVFEKKNGKKLKDAIYDCVPEGDYREFLAALINS